jgi:hypothetical protein
MLTEEARQEQDKQDIIQRITYNNEIIVAAAKYEREMSHKDFLEILKDIKNVKNILDGELVVLTKQLVMGDDYVERKTTLNEFMTKATRRMVIEEAVTYPERIIHQAAMAKEENVQLKITLKEKYNAAS